MKNNSLSGAIDKKDVFETVFNNIPLHVIITDPDGTILMANKAVEKITGFKQDEIIGKNPKLWGKQMSNSFYEEFWESIKDNKNTYTGIIKNKKKNGNQYHAAVKIAPILDEKKKLIGFCGIEQDITEIQKLSDEHDLSKRHREILKRATNLS